VDLPEHDETAARCYEWVGVELADSDEALVQFPSENVDHIATSRAEPRPADKRGAAARIGAGRGHVFLVSAGSFVFGVAAGATIVWLSDPSASRLTAEGAAAPHLLTIARPIEQVHTPAPPVAAAAEVRPRQPGPPASTTSPPSPSARLTAFRGSLVVSSQPSGAYVSLNGSRAGTTPLVLKNQRVGSRAVRIELDGYEAWTSAVQVVTNSSTNVRADLKAMRRVER
jgi:hypothetical protein